MKYIAYKDGKFIAVSKDKYYVNLMPEFYEISLKPLKITQTQPREAFSFVALSKRDEYFANFLLKLAELLFSKPRKTLKFGKFKIVSDCKITKAYIYARINILQGWKRIIGFEYVSYYLDISVNIVYVFLGNRVVYSFILNDEYDELLKGKIESVYLSRNLN
ncbi:MAG: hypothetical protein QW228_03370 [Candidatus Aenigmatarchaeota archaeon]